MRIAALITLVLAMLAGCTKDEDRIRFDGQVYRGNVSKSKEDRSQFSIAVTPVSASLTGAREAGRYEGTKYCIANYGTSKIDWTVGPDTDADAYVVVKDTLTFQGRCKP
jgi:hypothetical protein